MKDQIFLCGVKTFIRKKKTFFNRSEFEIVSNVIKLVYAKSQEQALKKLQNTFPDNEEYYYKFEFAEIIR